AEGGQFPLLRGPAGRDANDAASIATDPDLRPDAQSVRQRRGEQVARRAVPQPDVAVIEGDDEPSVRGERGAPNEGRVPHGGGDGLARPGVPDPRQGVGTGADPAWTSPPEGPARQEAHGTSR